MILLLTIVALVVALIVIVVTCVQVLYLEALRIRARELPALEFFKATLEAKIGLTTERGALTFSLVKHVGLAVLGCLSLAITLESAPLGEALAVACLLAGIVTVVGTFVDVTTTVSANSLMLEMDEYVASGGTRPINPD